ncbi:MAG: hypothetical protein ACR2LR_06485 [Hassallia sp.]
MPLFFAEICGYWGCSWLEEILAVLFNSSAIFALVIILVSAITTLILLSLPIILISSFISDLLPGKVNYEVKSDKLATRIGYAIKGGKLVYNWRRKNLNKINEKETSSPEQANSSARSRLIGRAIKLVNPK